jgi:O-antigen/teichoic acid export membrane protein
VKLSELVGKMAGLVGARLLGAAVGFASQLVLVRILTVEDVGIVFLGMSAASFVSLAANGGYSLLATTELPKLTAHGRKSLAEAFNKVAVLDSALAFVVMGAVAWTGTHFSGLTPGQTIAVWFGLLCAPASLIIRYNASMAMAARKFRIAYAPDFLFRPAALFIGLLIGAFAGWVHSAFAALIVFVSVTYLTALGQAVALRDSGIALRHFAWPKAAFAKRVRAKAFSLTLVSATMLAFADIVILLSGFVLPEKDVAVVGIAMRLAAIAGFVLQAGQMLVATDFTQALVRRENAVVNDLLKRINFTTVAIVLCGLVGALVFGDFVLGLFGDVYREGKWLLVLFMIGQSLRALGGMNQQILSINGFQLRTAGACLITLLILVCLSVLLCHAFGSIGMGYAVIGAELVWLVALATQAQQLCGRRGDLLWVLQRH